MGYVIHYSRVRSVIDGVLTAAVAFVLVRIVCLIFYTYLSEAASAGSWWVGIATVLLAVVAAMSLLVFIGYRRCYERDRQVCGIRLMGGPCALLYFPTSSLHVSPSASAEPLVESHSPVVLPAAAFPYDGHPAMAVTVTRVVHWPGRLVSLTFDRARPPDGALAQLAGPRMAPRVRTLRACFHRTSRGGAAGAIAGATGTVPMTAPRHLLIFADAMTAGQRRSLTISLACLQRGVTFVEHR